MEPVGDVGHVESRIGLFADSVGVDVRCMDCAKHTISSEIILDTLDGTPR
jgi:hypothetical protein